jgi:hypothetical protein
MGEWLGERIQQSIEWLSQQLKGFIDGIVAAVQGIWTALTTWIALQWQAMIAWVVSVLPPSNPAIDAFFSLALDIWAFFWEYILLAGYFLHFPTFAAVLGIILAGESVLLIIQMYLFIKRLIPVA